MSNKAITTNDLKAVLDVVLPPQPSEYKKLLWTNPSPTSAFGTQTISVDADEYDSIEVEFNGTSAPLIMSVRNSTYYVMTPAYNATPSYRAAKLPTTNGVYFDECHKNSGATIENSFLVPLHIYGIKYERVNPPQVEYNDYSTEEQEVGTFIDGKTIYRKSKIYTYAGSTNYDSEFFDGITPYQIINQRVQVMSNTAYAKTSDYWSSTDFCRCWIYLTSPYMVCFNLGGASNGAQVLMTVDYTKA